jgi:hypothetical protein
MIDGNLVFPRPPDEIINKRVYPTLDLNWGKGYIASEWALVDERRPESQIDCQVFSSDSPLKNMMDRNLVFPVPPDDIIKKRA